ncbi:alpha/beta hydrolase [Bacillus sp. 1P06AnD]|uniref:alpha/beta hydrolase n=1 Tax=Bacillus sp. 1P06AnD TaxID=3132208 RepID=UPI0039A32A9F
MEHTCPIMEGAEPFYYEGGSTGILLVHGFTGTTHSMRDLGKAYHQAGYSVCGPRLNGHGTSVEDMDTTSYQDWIESVEEGWGWLKERCDKIYVSGQSMGGTLTLYMAENHPEVQGIILINAAVQLPEMEDLAKQDLPRFIDEIGSDIKKPGVEELAYKKTPTRSVREILSLMEEVREHLPNISCPVLVLVSDEDHTVPPTNSELIITHITSEEKKLSRLHNSYHVATLDYDQPVIIEQSLAFFKQYE